MKSGNPGPNSGAGVGGFGPYLGGGGPESGALVGGSGSLGRPTADPRMPKPTNMGTAPNALAPPPTAPGNVLGSQVVRATGSGPFDSAYRQNLATYAGGLQNKPGGVLNLNPTNPNDPAFQNPTSLLSGALGGQNFQYSAPKPEPKKVAKGTNQNPDWQDWLTKRSRFGGAF